MFQVLIFSLTFGFSQLLALAGDPLVYNWTIKGQPRDVEVRFEISPDASDRVLVKNQTGNWVEYLIATEPSNGARKRFKITGLPDTVGPSDHPIFLSPGITRIPTSSRSQNILFTIEHIDPPANQSLVSIDLGDGLPYPRPVPEGRLEDVFKLSRILQVPWDGNSLRAVSAAYHLFESDPDNRQFAPPVTNSSSAQKNSVSNPVASPSTAAAAVAAPSTPVIAQEKPQRTNSLTMENGDLLWISNPSAPVAERVRVRIPNDSKLGGAWDAIEMKDDSGAEFLIYSAGNSSVGETFIIRKNRGRSFVRIANIGAAVRTHTIKDGILKLPGVNREIDLRAFDMECTFQTSRFSHAPSYSNPEVNVASAAQEPAVDPIAAALKPFRSIQDAVAARWDRIEDADPKIQTQIEDALTVPEGRMAVVLAESGVKPERILDEFAKAVIKGKTKIPRTWRMHLLDRVGMGAGTSYRGQDAERVQALLWASSEVPIIWFSPNFDQLKGVGQSAGDGGSSLNQVLGAVTQGNLILVTASEVAAFYAAYGGSSIAQMGRQISLAEPKGEELVNHLNKWINRNYRKLIEEQADLSPTPTFIERIIWHSNRYAAIGGQPDKAEKLATYLYSAFVEKQGRIPTPTEQEEMTMKYYGLPDYLADDAKVGPLLEQFQKTINSKVVGAEDAKKRLSGDAKTFAARISPPEKPNTVVFMTGTPGSGKTLVCKAYASAMNLPLEIITFSSDISSKEDVLSRIYSALQKNPATVICLDEFEKAPVSFQTTLLSILNDGVFQARSKNPYTGELGPPTRVQARLAQFIMTSNAGSDYIKDCFVNGVPIDHAHLEEIMMEGNASKGHNPIDSALLSRAKSGGPIVVLGPLERDLFGKMIEFALDQRIKQSEQNRRNKFHWVSTERKAEFISKLLDQYYERGIDNRAANGIIERVVGSVLADGVASGALREDYNVTLDLHQESAAESSVTCESLLTAQLSEPLNLNPPKEGSNL